MKKELTDKSDKFFENIFLKWPVRELIEELYRRIKIEIIAIKVNFIAARVMLLRLKQDIRVNFLFISALIGIITKPKNIPISPAKIFILGDVLLSIYLGLSFDSLLKGMEVKRVLTSKGVVVSEEIVKWINDSLSDTFLFRFKVNKASNNLRWDITWERQN